MRKLLLLAVILSLTLSGWATGLFFFTPTTNNTLYSWPVNTNFPPYYTVTRYTTFWLPGTESDYVDATDWVQYGDFNPSVTNASMIFVPSNSWCTVVTSFAGGGKSRPLEITQFYGGIANTNILLLNGGGDPSRVFYWYPTPSPAEYTNPGIADYAQVPTNSGAAGLHFGPGPTRHSTNSTLGAIIGRYVTVDGQNTVENWQWATTNSGNINTNLWLPYP